MPRYTLKTLCGTKQVEKFEHRPVHKLHAILAHPRHHMAGQTGPFGEILDHVNRCEIYEGSQMSKIFSGTIDDAIIFSKTLK